MKEKSLEEQADELLLELCHREHHSMRQLGMIDARRQRTISAREFSIEEYRPRGQRGTVREGDEDA